MSERFTGRAATYRAAARDTEVVAATLADLHRAARSAAEQLVTDLDALRSTEAQVAYLRERLPVRRQRAAETAASLAAWDAAHPEVAT